MKVVWLCHFCNSEFKEYFHTPEIKEFSPWINSLIKLFKDVNNNIEIHVVAPNVFNNTDHYLKNDNIYYHFYKYKTDLIPRKIYNYFSIDGFTNYFYIKNKIKKIINEIKPDLIHLHGAENPYYSAGILPVLNNYPTFLTIQGFIRNSTAKDFRTKHRIKIEEEIIKKIKYFGIRTKEMMNIILSLNPKAKLYWHNYPLNIPEFQKSNESDYDIVFFARVCKDKGIEDLLVALSIVKQEMPNVCLHIIGPISNSYKYKLNNMIQTLHLEQNVIFKGFMPTQEEVFKHAVKSKICVLPTYHDIIPGTIIESMYMKLPVIAYAVGGIPELNQNTETIRLVNKQDINSLAKEILYLLNNEIKRVKMANDAYDYAKKRFNNEEIVPILLEIYSEIIRLEKNKVTK